MLFDWPNGWWGNFQACWSFIRKSRSLSLCSADVNSYLQHGEHRAPAIAAKEHAGPISEHFKKQKLFQAQKHL